MTILTRNTTRSRPSVVLWDTFFGGLFDNIGPRMEGNLYRTVFIDTPTVGTLDFDMTPADRKAAVDAGYKATLKYFQ